MSRLVAAVRVGLACALLAGCATLPAHAGSACPPSPADLRPTDGAWLGVNLDWGAQTLDGYSDALGHRPAVVVSFAALPLSAADRRNVDAAVAQVADGGGVLLLTLEPRDGLAAVTPEVADALADRLARYNRRGVPVIVRFAHEMNGSWYPWGQQPAAYVAAFRRVAAAVHSRAPGSATMWAPNYGGGYPFAGGTYETPEGAAGLDTDGDGAVTPHDDPYRPYWPGDDAVDWVGMSLYHWGAAYPWGENELPEPGAFAARLTGSYVGAAGDERAVPDFYADYSESRGKPMAIPETAALYVPGAGGADELAVKQAWWRQVFAPDVPQRFPRLALVDWFEWAKQEPEVHAVVDWRATATSEVRSTYAADLPSWARWADDVPTCG
jgi:hypothetical protein